MKKIILYDKKNEKNKTNNVHEYDLGDLETLVIFRHGKEFLEIPEFKIDQKTIVEHFELEGISWWWFAAPIIHPKYKDAMLFIDRLSILLKENNYEILELKGCFDKLSIIKDICEKQNVKLAISRKDYFQYLKNLKLKNIVKKTAYKKIHQNKTKKRFEIFKKNKTDVNILSGYVLIVSPEVYRRESFDILKNKTLDKEYFISPFIEYCKKNDIPLLGIDLDYTFRGVTEKLEQRIKSDTNWIPIEYIINKEKTTNVKKTIKNFERTLNNFKKIITPEVFSYKGISLWSVIKPVIDDLLLEPHFPTYFQVIDKIEEFLKKTKPRVIIQTYEAGPYAKAIELVAEKLGIKTIALQHGLILSNTPDYFFNQIRTRENPLGNIVPDITLVFSEYYKQLLINKSAFTKEQVEVFGHPEYFEIDEIKSKIEKQKLVQTETNWNDKTIILIPMSFRYHHVRNSPDRILLDLVYEKLNQEQDIIVLIRPHPGDNFTENDLKKEFPSNNFFLSKHSLIEDIIISDLLISLPISTVNTEAIMFDKPIIFPDIIEKNRLEIDPIFQVLIEKQLANIVSKEQLISEINRIKKSKDKRSLELEKEKIVDFICHFKSKPKLEKYVSY